MPISPQEASIRADCYIDSALRLINVYPDTMKRYGKEASKSALNMQLKPILGAELTKLLCAPESPSSTLSTKAQALTQPPTIT